jgi:F-type H+-transporting ATPase subunit a
MQISKILTIYSTTSPLDQFAINKFLCLYLPIFGKLEISITNIGLYLSLAAFIILMLNVLPNFDKVVSNK